MKTSTLNYLSLFTPTRQEMLFLWMSRHGFSYAKVGRLLGMSKGGAHLLLKKDTAPTHRVQSLLELGFPPVLLPEAKDFPPGPKVD